MKSIKKHTVIDLFAGAGGFSCAAQHIGFKLVAAIENNAHACETYRNNFIVNKKSPPILFENDINQLEPIDVINPIKRKFATKEVDVIIGGPPCQGFSKHRFKDTGVNDPRNELLLRYFQYIHELRPKFFIVENVTGLLWKRHEKYLTKFYKLAFQNGYTVEPPIILDAKNYGVPQNRKRVFILGKRADINWSRCYSWPPPKTNFSPNAEEVTFQKLPQWIKADVIFTKELAQNDPNAIHMHHTEELIEVFASTPQNGGSRNQSKRNLPCHAKHKGHNDVYGRICTIQPGPTMTTGCTNPSKGRFLHPFENHGITVRHAARFQTFPESFIFSGGIISSSRQIGNAVPVLLGERVLSVIKNELDILTTRYK
ncbi:MAG: DNA (cytosine-5-)-methyltransferase [Lentisphaerae bacterium GWF2_44_16]|nr:MAG: DNA (cytosine-5-)-methyltransferase [Lentisphaerae bacterium GWF2_44_16]